MRSLRPQFTFANVMSSIAVFVALSSGAYAATQLPKNSVGGDQLRADSVGVSELKDDAVTSAAVKNGTLKEQDLAPAARSALTGKAGAAGAAGAPGAVGAPGAAGAPGEAGAPGPAGGQGTRGPTGAQGFAGTVGPNGLAGATGPTGAVGPTGNAGPAGSAAAWAEVKGDGTVGNNLKVAGATEKTPAAGESCLNVLTPFRPKAVVATLDLSAADSRDTIAATVDPTAVAAKCNTGANVLVITWSFSQGAPVDEGYYVMFN